MQNNVKDQLPRRMHGGAYIGDLVYGATDGIVTTFAVVAAAAGASLSPAIVIILGIANLFADGFSMGASNVLALRSKKKWTDSMMKENLEIQHSDTTKPISHGIATFIAFVVAGFLPLLPYVFGIVPLEYRFIASMILAGATFFLVGAARTLVTTESPLKAGTEILCVGGLASGVAYLIGATVKTVFGITM